ncbi:MAG: hypothetical protein HY898_01645 [Deltaproteobacteria bacterium]|nr:hypothetical protein [Deltaproteobacteria bacterium]
MNARPPTIALACAAIMMPATAKTTEPERASLVRVAVEPSGDCPELSAFPDRLKALSGRLRIVAPWVEAPLLRVRVVRSDAGLRGVLVSQRRGSEEVAREIEGARCEDIVAALALVAALQIDPPATGVPITYHLSSASKDAPSSWKYGLGVGAGWMAASDMPWFSGLRLWADTRADRSGLLSPAFRLAALRLQSGTVHSDAADSSFTLTAVSADACPLHWPGNDLLHAEPCVRVVWGRMSGTATGVAEARSEDRDWLAAGLAGRAMLHPVGPLVVIGEASWEMPLLRYQFYLDPGTPLLRIPAHTFGLTIGLGLQFD